MSKYLPPHETAVKEYLSSHEIAVEAGEPHSVVRVSNIQAAVKVGTDAWGRSGKVQPVLISVSVSLRRPFSTASAEDSVNGSTIHYGILSKAILEAVSIFEEREPTLTSLWDHIVASLVGTDTNQMFGFVSIIDRRVARSLELKITLPKASLIGNGVSIYGTMLFQEDDVNIGNQTRGLKLHDLRIATLIGVNPNERLAKQIVVANIDMNPWYAWHDEYPRLEELVVKVKDYL